MLPFVGIACDRPYPATGLTTQRWIAEVPVVAIKYSSLTLTQSGVDIGRLFNAVKLDYEADDYPHVVAYEDVLYLEDGHHRICREALLNPTGGAMMRVFHIS